MAFEFLTKETLLGLGGALSVGLNGWMAFGRYWVTEFNAFEYISAARNHFGMRREEAEQLTMTEFQMLLAAKYPEQKGFTREEYSQITDDYLAKKAKRLAKSA